MTREQQYIQEQYMRRQFLLRHAAIIAGGAYDEEQHRKEYPREQQDLIDAFADSSIKKITLTADMDFSEGNVVLSGLGTEKTIVISEDATITKSSTAQDSVFNIDRGTTLTINGSGKVLAGNTMCALKVTRNGDTAESVAKVVINDVTLSADPTIVESYGITGNGNRDGSDITINSGTIIGKVAIYQPQGGNTTINGGLIEGPDGFVTKDGTILITGGTFHSTALSAEYVHNGNGWTSTGDAFAVEACDPYSGTPEALTLSVRVTGGTFIADHGKPIASYAQTAKGYTALSAFVYGGTFNKQIDEWLIAEGHTQEFNEETSMWEVK